MKRRTLEEKQDIISNMDMLLRQGMSVKEASRNVGLISPTDHIRIRKWLESHSAPVREVIAVNYEDPKLLKARIKRLEAIVIEQMLDIQTLKEYNNR